MRRGDVARVCAGTVRSCPRAAVRTARRARLGLGCVCWVEQPVDAGHPAASQVQGAEVAAGLLFVLVGFGPVRVDRVDELLRDPGEVLRG